MLTSIVPNGGYVATHFLKVARMHLESRNQRDTLTAHWEFLLRSAIGPAVFLVEDIKLGRQTSVLHMKLYQGSCLLNSAPWVDPDQKAKAIAVGYITQTNFSLEQGLSLETGYGLHPPIPPVDLDALDKGEDPNWERMGPPNAAFKKVRWTEICMLYAPRAGQPRKSIMDMWARLPHGEKFTGDKMGYVIDAWPTVVESYRPSPPPEGQEPTEENLTPFSYNEIYWYPTVVLNLEIKKALPDEGEEWLFMRVLTRQIKNGRLDLEVLVYDKSGDLVAVSSHVNLVLGMNRNEAGRKKSSL